MDNSEIRKEIQEEVRKAEKILVGIGAEWKRGMKTGRSRSGEPQSPERAFRGEGCFYHIHTDSGGDGGQRF